MTIESAPSPIAFGAQLRAARTQAGLTQRELADDIGASHTHVTRLERGDYEPSPKTREDCAEALGVEDWDYVDVTSAAAEPSRQRVGTVARRLDLVPVEADVDGLPTRPRTRGECVNGPRPCPFASCQFHLYLTVDQETGALTTNHAGEIEDMRESCALDIADRGGASVDEVATALGVTRQRVEQIEGKALRKLRVALEGLEL